MEAGCGIIKILMWHMDQLLPVPFHRNTAYGLIRLIIAGSSPERGQFYCIIPDAAGTIQSLYVNIGMHTTCYANNIITCNDVMEYIIFLL